MIFIMSTGKRILQAKQNITPSNVFLATRLEVITKNVHCGGRTKSAGPDGVFRECKIAARLHLWYIPESGSGGTYFQTSRNPRATIQSDGHHQSLFPREANSHEFYLSKKIAKRILKREITKINYFPSEIKVLWRNYLISGLTRQTMRRVNFALY